MSASLYAPGMKKMASSGNSETKGSWNLVHIILNAHREVVAHLNVTCSMIQRGKKTEKSCAVSSGAHYELKVCRKDRGKPSNK